MFKLKYTITIERSLKPMSNKKTDKSRTHAANVDDGLPNSDHDMKKVPTSATNNPKDRV
jgi:hypothetical protein